MGSTGATGALSGLTTGYHMVAASSSSIQNSATVYESGSNLLPVNTGIFIGSSGNPFNTLFCQTASISASLGVSGTFLQAGNYVSNVFQIQNSSLNPVFSVDNNSGGKIGIGEQVIPLTTASYPLGSTSARFSGLFTNALNLQSSTNSTTAATFSNQSGTAIVTVDTSTPSFTVNANTNIYGNSSGTVNIAGTNTASAAGIVNITGGKSSTATSNIVSIVGGSGTGGSVTVNGGSSGSGTVKVGYSSVNSAQMINVNESNNLIQLGTAGSHYYSLVMGGGNSTGGVYANFSTLGEGVNFGYNYYTINGTATIPNTGLGTSRIIAGPSYLTFACATANTAPINIVNITNNGIYPATDNVYACGQSSFRWTTVYAVNGSINTSAGNLKKNILPLNSGLGLSFIQQLKPVTFNWANETPDEPFAGDVHMGFVFEDVQSVTESIGFDGSSPERSLYLVQEPEIDEDGIETPGGLAPTELLASLVLAVQELSATNKTLLRRVVALEKFIMNSKAENSENEWEELENE
jgi:hypothetical protein